jgi:hypothetical protein
MSLTEMPLDAADHRRSPVTMPGYHQGRPPKNGSPGIDVVAVRAGLSA